MHLEIARTAKMVARVLFYVAGSACARPGRDVVYSVTTAEGNAVEVARSLIAREGRRVTFLYDAAAPSDSAQNWSRRLGSGGRRSVAVPRRSLRGIWALISAERVFFTHALWGALRPPIRTTYVNLWHGDGPKTTVHAGSADGGVPSNYVVSGTRLWGESKKAAFGSSSGKLLIVGNPRIDQFDRPLTAQQREQLNLHVSDSIVLWAPTYRLAKVPGGPAWSDVGGSANPYDLLASSDIAFKMAQRNQQLVIKPHPFDAAVKDVPGAVMLTDDQLLAVGVEPYQLLGAASALITDYSSIWTDFLVLDRPIILFCPDLEAYRVGRGLPLGFESFLPGALTESLVELEAVVLGAVPEQRRVRAEVASRLGSVTATGATDRLLREIPSRRGRIRGARE